MSRERQITSGQDDDVFVFGDDIPSRRPSVRRVPQGAKPRAGSKVRSAGTGKKKPVRRAPPPQPAPKGFGSLMMLPLVLLVAVSGFGIGSLAQAAAVTVAPAPALMQPVKPHDTSFTF